MPKIVYPYRKSLNSERLQAKWAKKQPEWWAHRGRQVLVELEKKADG